MNEIVGLAGKEELAKLVQRLNKASIAYGMEISAEKTEADDKQHQWHQHSYHSKTDRSLRLSEASSAWAQL